MGVRADIGSMNHCDAGLFLLKCLFNSSLHRPIEIHCFQLLAYIENVLFFLLKLSSGESHTSSKFFMIITHQLTCQDLQCSFGIADNQDTAAIANGAIMQFETLVQ